MQNRSYTKIKFMSINFQFNATIKKKSRFKRGLGKTSRSYEVGTELI